MAEKKEFDCPLGLECDLDEDTINEYDPTEYMDILELLEEHNIDMDQAKDFMQAQNLLFEHILQRENAKSGGKASGEGIRTNIVQAVVKEHQERRKRLLNTAENVKSFLQRLPENRKKEMRRYFPTLNVDIERVIEELKNEKCSFIVAGETGSGKSCFINLLMGHIQQNFLPVSNCPSTSCLCEISYGKQGKLRAYTDDPDKPVAEIDINEDNMAEKLSEYTHQKDNREKITYKRVEVKWPLDWLESGLTIVDSPGVGEGRVITEMVKQMMPKAFGFIYVINTTKAGGIQEGELEDLLFTQSRPKPVMKRQLSKQQSTEVDDTEKSLSDEFDPRTAIFVFNKWDLVDNRERDKIKEFAHNKLKKIYKNIDTESQMFFMSTQQAREALKEKQYQTEEYKRVLKGIERLMEFSLKSKMKKYYSYFADLLSRLVFILKAYVGNFADVEKKYKDVKKRLERLKKASAEVKEKMKKALTEEVEVVVEKLKSHLLSEETKRLLCKWHDSECPKHFQNWEGLQRVAKVESDQRVKDEIKRWESQTEIMQRANEKLLKLFQEEFVSIKDNLSDIENDLLSGDVKDKDLRKLLGDINHSISPGDDISLDKSDKIILGVTAPIWIPVGLVIGILATPFLLGFAAREAMKERKKERQFYEGYVSGESGTLADLMANETESAIAQVTSGDGLKDVIETNMKDLVTKMLILMKRIPDYIKADEELLSGMRDELREGSNKNTKTECEKLVKEVGKIQMDLDYFLLMHIHEYDIDPKDLTLEGLIADGSYGKISKATWNTREGKKSVAVKRIFTHRGTKSALTMESASEIRLEDSNMRKLKNTDNIVKYYGLCMNETAENGQNVKVPLLVMELCSGSLDDIIYDISKYLAPGTLTETDSQRRETLLRMANFSMQIAKGLMGIHKCGFVHRDLKPANIMVNEDKTEEGKTEYHLKLGDFGLSKKEADICSTECGTPLYMAPEVKQGSNYDRKSDIFSYGLILIELFYGKLVHQLGFIEVDLHPVRFRGDPLEFCGPSDEWKKFMAPCWSLKPEDRPTAEQCYAFFKEQINTAM